VDCGAGVVFREEELRPNLGEGDDMATGDDALHPVQPPKRISFGRGYYILRDLCQHSNKHIRDILIFILDLY
jgi:hypothetical protein